MNRKKYNAIDWLRVIGCIGILASHVRGNIPYDLPGYMFNRIIVSFTDFVILFMAISSFGLCCGYYQSFKDGTINWEHFYKRRFSKILPFFIALILLDLCVSFSFDSFMQGLVESTLFHGFIPVEFTVIGVGWFLGLIFIFYLSFPFFCVLLKNKRTGWIAFTITIGLSLICQYHFNLDRSNFAFSFCYFFIGGLIFLYKEKIEKMKWWHLVVFLVSSIILYYFITNTLTCILLSASILAFAVSLNIRSFMPVKFLSSISMHIYLCHMVIFRVLEKLHFMEMFGGGIIQYLITCFIVFIGACTMSVVFNYIYDRLSQFIKNTHPVKHF